MYEIALLAAGGAITFGALVVIALRRDTARVKRSPNQKLKLNETIVAKTHKEHTT